MCGHLKQIVQGTVDKTEFDELKLELEHVQTKIEYILNTGSDSEESL